MSFGTKVKVLTVAYNSKKFPELSSLAHLLVLSPMTPAIVAFFLILRAHFHFMTSTSCPLLMACFPRNAYLLPIYDMMLLFITFTILSSTFHTYSALRALSIKKVKNCMCSGQRVL